MQIFQNLDGPAALDLTEAQSVDREAAALPLELIDAGRGKLRTGIADASRTWNCYYNRGGDACVESTRTRPNRLIVLVDVWLRDLDTGSQKERTMRKTAVFVLLLLASGICLVEAQEINSRASDKKAPTEHRESAQELAAIRKASDAFVAAFNKGDAKAVAALWTKDGEYIDDAGRRFTGRDAIEKGYAEFFADNAKVKIRIMIDALRLLSDDAAIEDGRAVVNPAPAGDPGIGKYTVVHVKVEGKWLMSSVRDIRIEASSAYRNIADLEWLIGAWVAEEHGVKTESVCRWIANKSFLERNYTITQVDGTQASGIQLIGWNPLDGHVQSWNFSPDGGHAVGVWAPEPGGWVAIMRGPTVDGTPTTAINKLRRLDDQAYVWQSLQRTAGGLALPDTDEVVWKRQPVSR